MQGGVNYNGSTLLTGGINVNTTGNIQALNVQVTENGERTITPPEGVDGYAPITIDTNVPIPEPVLDTLNVTSNGTYTPPSGVDGYDEITVNVSQDADIQPLTRTITTNGTTVINASDLNVDGFDPVTITTAVDGYTIKTLTNTPTPIASFTDGTSNPLKSLTASIVPVQDLHGYDGPWAGGAGKNKLNLDFTNDTDSFSGLTFSHTDSTFKLKGTVSGQNYRIFNLTLPPNVDLNTDYTLSAVVTGTVSSCLVSIYFKNGNTDTENIRIDISDTTPKNTKQFSAQFDNATFVIEGLHSGSYFDCEVKIQLEKGSSATAWTPYSNICPITGWTEEVITVTDDVDNPTVTHTTTIPFTDGQGQSVTVYGGDIDVISGEVTPCLYYASYNGEELTGEWISDRDVYSPNTTPTTGAQVVNIGATGTPFYTQPASIKSLDGENNVSASTGDVEELKYFADL